MFDSFKTFISEFVDSEKHSSQFAENDYRLVAASKGKSAIGGKHK